MYEDLLLRIKKTLEKYNLINSEYRYILCWSGGKDSTALFYVLQDLFIKLELCLDVVIIPFPVNIFNSNSLLTTIDKLKSKNLNFHILNHDYNDFIDIDFSDACPQCKKIRQQIFKSWFNTKIFDTNKCIIFTGHTLYDLASYVNELFMVECTNNISIQHKYRTIENMNKFIEVFHSQEGIRIVRPFLSLNSYDVKVILKSSGRVYPLPFVQKECDWLNQRKRILHSYYESMDLYFDYEVLYRFAKNSIVKDKVLDYNLLPFYSYLM